MYTSNRRILHLLGSGHEWPLGPWSVEWSPSHVAHQLPGDAGRISSIKHFLPELRDRHVFVRTGNTAVVCYINHQGGLHLRPLYKLAHQILWWSQVKLLSLRTVHIPGHLYMGADILSRQGPRPGEWMLQPEEVRQTWRIWPGSGGPVCDSRDIALSPLILSDPSNSTGAGCQGTDVAEASSVHLSPITQKSPVLAGPSMHGPDFPSRLISVEISIRRDLLSQAEDTICPPRS